MPGWIVAAGLGSIALTALLTFILWRLNAPRRLEHDGGGGDAGALVGAHRPDNDGDGTFDGGSDGGGGGDGGGD